MTEVYEYHRDDIFEGLSSGKKGNMKLVELRKKFGAQDVAKIRNESKLPEQVAQILENKLKNEENSH